MKVQRVDFFVFQTVHLLDRLTSAVEHPLVLLPDSGIIDPLSYRQIDVRAARVSDIVMDVPVVEVRNGHSHWPVRESISAQFLVDFFRLADVEGWC